MPFDFKKYDTKCATLDGDALQREWEHYTRLISGAATSTAVSGLAIPFTMGVSTIGVTLAAPAIHNAKKKREIIEKHLQRCGRTHHTRKRDVVAAGAISGTVGVVTLGLAPVGADAICNSAAEHGIAYIAENELGVKIATHLALDAAAVAAEESHMHSKKEQEAWKAYAQAIREGKHAPLPVPNSQSSVTTNNRMVDMKVEHQDTFFQPAPSVYFMPGSDQKTTESATMYFPPPPGKTEASLPPQSNGHLLIGTTTAISTPMVGGQSYCIQAPRQTPYTSDRPSSAVGGRSLPEKQVEIISSANSVSQQHLVFPPPPPHLFRSTDMGIQQNQNQAYVQQSESHASNFPDDPPAYEMCQQTQPSYGTLQLPAPPPHVPRPSPYCTPNIPMLDYPGTLVSAGKPIFQDQPQYEKSIGLCNQSAWLTPYDPKTYGHMQQQCQDQNFHAPAQLVYSPQDIRHQAGYQKIPHVSQYEVYSPRIETSQFGTSIPALTGSSAYNAKSYPQAHYSYPTEKTNIQQIPYFPPPPPTY